MTGMHVSSVSVVAFGLMWPWKAVDWGMSQVKVAVDLGQVAHACCFCAYVFWPAADLLWPSFA